MEKIKVESAGGLIPSRDVYVYLPNEYFDSPSREFPALYMFDGQNIWDSPACPYGGWKADSSAERLRREGKIKSAVIVGIANSAYRTREYAGWCDSLPGEENAPTKEYPLYAREHMLLVENTIIPTIEARYRVIADRENRFVAGSSYGAFLAAYFAAARPLLFSAAGLFSGGGSGYAQIVERDLIKDASVKIYADCGGADALERALLPGTRDLKKYLLRKGYKEGENLLVRESPRDSHNEIAWAKRFPRFLEFILGTRLSF